MSPATLVAMLTCRVASVSLVLSPTALTVLPALSRYLGYLGIELCAGCAGSCYLIK